MMTSYTCIVLVLRNIVFGFKIHCTLFLVLRNNIRHPTRSSRLPIYPAKQTHNPQPGSNTQQHTITLRTTVLSALFSSKNII